MVHIDGVVFSLQRHGGITVYFRELISELADSGMPYSISLESPFKQDMDGLIEQVGAEVRKARILERYRAGRTHKQASVFHSSYYRLPAQRSVPTVVTVHDFIYERYRRGAGRWIHMAQKHAAIRAAQSVICISESTRNDLLEWVGETPGQQVHVIHNGVSELFRPLGPAAANSEKPYMLFVGERKGYKNFSLAVDALRFLPDMELCCVGGGPLVEDDFRGCSASARTRVRHLGYVDDAELNRRYNEAVCLLYPSAYEGFGIPVVEAMRAGCPVVCIDCKAVLEVGQDAVIRAEFADGECIAGAVQVALDDARRARHVGRGLEISEQFSWRKCHRQTLELYRGLGASDKNLVTA